MLRIALFLGTNFAILLILSVSMSILGIEGALDEQGVGLDLNSLLIISSIIGFSGSIISLFISKWMAKKSMGVKIISTPKNDTEKWLLSINKELSQKANINVPEFGIFDSKQPNAFATGSSKNNSLVAVSTGLLVTMNKDEVEAVVAHEICHISNGDMVTMSLIQGIINTFVIFFSRIIGHLVDRLVFKVQRGHGPAYFITSIIGLVIVFILSLYFLYKITNQTNNFANLNRLKTGPIYVGINYGSSSTTGTLQNSNYSFFCNEVSFLEIFLKSLDLSYKTHLLT